MGQTIPQESKHDAQQILQILDAIQSTAKYMSEIVMVQDQYSSVRYECYNYDEHCAALASQGACRQPPMDDDSGNDDGFDHDEGEEAAAAIASQWELYNFMMMQCAPSCHACENMFPTDDETVIQECTPDYSMDIFGHHGMHEMFQRIIGEIPFEDGTIVPDYKVQVLSRPIKPQHDKPGVDVHSLDYHVGPWIIILDDFLTNEECDRLIELGSIEGYKRSELEEEWHKDEEEIRKERESEDAYRTSTNSWCMEECYRDPIAKRVMQKIENVTGVPESHSEYLQLLRYGEYSSTV
jgi:prolyl 4-hydroxylase